MAKTHCFRCKVPLEPERVGLHSWCTPCLKAYKKTFNKGPRVFEDKRYVINESGVKIKLLPTLVGYDYKRFWKKVEITANPDKCWNWTASHLMGEGKQPYGKISFNKIFYFAHRISYLMHYKEDPREMCVLHKCDNPRCVNPAHLFLGTNDDNVQDKKSKGRHRGFKMKPKSYEGTARGVNHGMSKLNNQNVIQIKEEYCKGGITYQQLGSKYGVSKKTILNIINNRTWKHV